jgi:hypothetical protein
MIERLMTRESIAGNSTTRYLIALKTLKRGERQATAAIKPAWRGQARSRYLQFDLLKLPFHAVCGGVFNTEPEPAEEDKNFLLFADWEYFHDVRQQQAAVDERKGKRT